MNSVEKVKTICKERKIAISKLERDLGFSNGYIRGLREGRFPADRLKAIADYLGVTIEFLLDAEDNAPKETAFIPKTTVEKKFVALFRSMGDETEEEKKAFEQYFETTIDMFLAKKGINLEDIE
mgnify:CR=1 FL=1